MNTVSGYVQQMVLNLEQCNLRGKLNKRKSAVQAMKTAEKAVNITNQIFKSSRKQNVYVVVYP